MKQLMFYCQHLLGVGHLVRSFELARELALDFDVTFVAGGAVVTGLQPPDGVRLVRLPALEADGDSCELRPCDPNATLEETRERRQRELLEIVEKWLPDVLVIELYPFGRRQFSFELKPLLKRARQNHTRVVCSLRDVLVRKRNQPEHEQRVCDLVNEYFDLILVHADPAFVQLEETFSRAADLRCPLRYTGYVAQSGLQPCPVAGGGRPVVVGSVGGGRCECGHDLLRAVVGAAAALERRLPHEFRIFAGPVIAEDEYARLETLVAGRSNITLQKFTPDLISQLEAADLSVSLGGYNTVMDLLRTKVRALIYPAMPNGDLEQTLRAEKLARAGVIELITPDGLAPSRLAGQIERALASQPQSVVLNLNGAANSRELLRSLAARHSPEARCVA
jgi:predicted glycosyltransferase